MRIWKSLFPAYAQRGGRHRNSPARRIGNWNQSPRLLLGEALEERPGESIAQTLEVIACPLAPALIAGHHNSDG